MIEWYPSKGWYTQIFTNRKAMSIKQSFFVNLHVLALELPQLSILLIMYISTVLMSHSQFHSRLNLDVHGLIFETSIWLLAGSTRWCFIKKLQIWYRPKPRLFRVFFSTIIYQPVTFRFSYRLTSCFGWLQQLPYWQIVDWKTPQEGIFMGHV